MTDAKIGDNVVINKAIIGGEAKIRKDCKIGNGEKISDRCRNCISRFRD